MKQSLLLSLAVLTGLTTFGCSSVKNAFSPQTAKPSVTTAALLEEMIDLNALADAPQPAFKCAQFSSYDRASTDSTNQTDEGWYANRDIGQYLRVEERNGQQEYVMMDAEGPGAIVRIWSANPHGTLRIYLDGATTPTLEMPMEQLMQGETFPFIAPLAHIAALGWNVYFPIPYARHCKVTSANDIFYHIGYRTYAPGTTVESWDPAATAALEPLIRRVAARLNQPETFIPPTGKVHAMPYATTLAAGKSWIVEPDEGQRAIQRMTCKLDVPPDQIESALRQTVVEITFDDQATPSVSAPLGDFFGTGLGLNRFRSLPAGVLDDGTLYLHWTMPYRQKAQIRLLNRSPHAVSLAGEIVTSPRAWTSRTEYFHAKWRGQEAIPTFPRRDWTILAAQGRGRYVGTLYHVYNPVVNWWGEGDEKIYVDGESFPSTFGTGSEDYFGYAWCWFEPFTHAYHNQVRADGPGNLGNTCVSRFHVLDSMPFETAFRFDIEVWHHLQTTTETLATTAFWYAAPAATDDFPSIETAPLPLPRLPEPMRVADVIEGEAMPVLACTGGVTADRFVGPALPDGAPGLKAIPTFPCLVIEWHSTSWSGWQQRWWHQAQSGNALTLGIPVPKAGRYKIFANFAKGDVFGTFAMQVNGQPTPAPLILRAKDVGNTGRIELGTFDLKAGQNPITFTVQTETPPPANGIYLLGLDYLQLEPAQ